MQWIHFVLPVLFFTASVASGGSPQGKKATMQLAVPGAMKLEHEELHSALAKATNEPGAIGVAAKAVAELLHHHFVNEEEFALPPLALLPQLAKGNVTKEMEGVLEMTDRLKADLPTMLKEHQAIVKALDGLVHAATSEGRQEYVQFAQKLKLHAQTEEEITYPTALLIGEFVRLKLKK